MTNLMAVGVVLVMVWVARRYPRLVGRLLALLFLLGAVGTLAFFLVGGIREAWLDHARRTGYRRVAATARTSQVGSRLATSSSLTYFPQVTYRYVVGAEIYIRSQVTPSERTGSEAWANAIVDRYRPGQVVTAYYDPTAPGAAFLVNEASYYPYVFIAVAVALISLWVRAAVRQARRRQAGLPAPGTPRGPSPEASPQGVGVLLGGLISFGTGLFAVLLWVGAFPIDPASLKAPSWVVGACGGAFLVAGALMLAQELIRGFERSPRFRAVLGAILATFLALAASWVAFGPGERQFSISTGSGFGAVSSRGGEFFGRAVFGFGSVMVDAITIYFWRVALRRKPKA